MGSRSDSGGNPGTDSMKDILSAGKALTFEHSHFSEDRFEALGKVLENVLQSIGRPDFLDPLRYILNELITNADKANAKRLFFQEKNLKIHKPHDYQKGMALFSDLDAIARISLKSRLGEKGLFTRVEFLAENQTLKISVTNNSLPTEDELLRISSRINSIRTMKEVADAFHFFYDESEGAGFGIITTILSLRSLGAHDDPYRFVPLRESGESLQEIRIPANALSDDHIETLSEEISKEIKSIPKLPENVIEIQRMLSNPDRALSEIGDRIARDPSLTAELLKIVNSAHYMLPQKITNIQNAASMLGVTGLKNMMTVYGAQKALNSRYGDLHALWHHAYRCAFYAGEIARRYGFSEDAEDLYVSGILHDIGKIALLTLHSGLIEKLSMHYRDSGIPRDYLETLVLGIGHAKTGAMIVRQWHLPENLGGPIEYHHRPYLAPEQLRNFAYVVHLADLMANGYDEGGLNFKNVPQGTLDFFEIETADALNALAASLAEKLAEKEIGY